MIEIRHRYTGDVILCVEADTLRGYDFSGLDLTGADLAEKDLTRAKFIGAKLTGAKLAGANLTGADLTGADLTGADLTRAKLVGAKLVGANLAEANLARANLTRADLTGAKLTRANLTEADLTGANLAGADLAETKADVLSILAVCRAEVPGLRSRLVEGRIDGSCYEGECCCLVGSIASERGCNYSELESIKPDASRPAERWFTGIAPGDTPETNPVAAITLGWVDDFLATAN